MSRALDESLESNFEFAYGNLPDNQPIERVVCFTPEEIEQHLLVVYLMDDYDESIDIVDNEVIFPPEPEQEPDLCDVDVDILVDGIMLMEEESLLIEQIVDEVLLQDL